jgi:hypothetical protein
MLSASSDDEPLQQNEFAVAGLTHGFQAIAGRLKAFRLNGKCAGH